MRFLSPKTLWMFLPVWALLPVLWYLIEKKAAGQLYRFASSPLLGLILKGGDPEGISRRRCVRFALGLLALLCAIVALARPQIGVREETIPSEGLDMVFLLDVSNSMLTEDIVPSRLKKAKHVVKNFLDRLSGDRAGIVAFAGSSFPAVPLTADYEFVKQTLEVIDESSISNQGTNLAKALTVALDLLKRGGLSDDADPTQEKPLDGSSRVVIILSDGESFEGEETKLVDRLKAANVRVFGIGVGSTKGALIPIRDPNGYMRGYKKDEAGNIVLTKLESSNLEAIAAKTGGKYYMASSNEGEVEEILGLMTSMDRTEGAGRRVIVYDEIYQYPLGFGIFLLMAMLWLRETPRKRETLAKAPELTAALALAYLALGFVPMHEAKAGSISEYSDTKRGIDAYNDKDYAGAIQHFGKAQANSPESDVHHMNLGDALLKSGSIDGAAAEFEAATKDKDATKAARGAYNLGKTHEQAKDFEKAIRALQLGLDRLAQDPKADPEVEERIKRALEVVVQKKQQQQEQKNDGKNDQKQDQSDQQDKKKDKQEQKYDVPKRKPQFKGEKLKESDAKRLMTQLQEQEKKSQQRVMRNKTGKPKDEKTGKDW